MTTVKEKNISSFYSDLHKFDQNGEYERAIKAANKILQLAPDEVCAFHCKVVCLIQLSKFEDALQQMNKNQALAKELYFERAYCQYRVNSANEALKTIDSATEMNVRLKELQAQIYYRLELYHDAHKVYQEIIKNTHDDYEDERETNLAAVLANMSQTNADYSNQIRENTYELCFNAACCLIAKGQFLDAERKLKQCEKLCREALEEDGTPDDEMDSEVAIVRIQLGYVVQKLGRQKEAQLIYQSVLKLKLDDAALTAVASNNAAVINKNQNLFDSKKKMKAAMHDTILQKLNSEQKKQIALNNCILSFYTNQMDQCSKLARSVAQNWPDLEPYARIMEALIFQKDERYVEALRVLENVQSDKDDDQLYLNLARVQILLLHDKRREACTLLENMGDNSYKPGIVGALITLYLGLGDENTALKVFEKTVQYHRKHKINEGDLSNMWRQAAEFHIKYGHPQVAAHSLEELLRSNPKDMITIAQLMLACAAFDEKRTIELSKSLPSLDDIIGKFDAESLENHWVVMKKSTAKVVEASPTGTPKSDGSKKKKKHRKRKGKLPQNYDMTATPDPERWLPKYERTGYRKKRDRRTKDVLKGSQGIQSGQSDIYDFSGRQVNQDDDNQTTPEAVQTPKGHVKKNQQKKKNKRR